MFRVFRCVGVLSGSVRALCNQGLLGLEALRLTQGLQGPYKVLGRIGLVFIGILWGL